MAPKLPLVVGSDWLTRQFQVATDAAPNVPRNTVTLTGTALANLLALTNPTLTLDQAVFRYILNNTALISALTIAFPASPFDGEEHRICNRMGVTALTYSGGTTVGLPASVSAGVPFGFVYSATAGAWFRDS